MRLIRAAGGLLWRVDPDGSRRLAVIHRPRRDDWSLPKGKLKDGEGWQEGALREVYEETGCRARPISFAGLVHYVPKHVTKVVVFWHMELQSEGPIAAPDEVDVVAWLTRREALRRLDHETERELLRQASAPDEQAAAGVIAVATAGGELDEVRDADASCDGSPFRPPLLALALAAATAGGVSGLAAHWLGPPGSTPVAIAAAVLGSIGAAVAWAVARPARD